MWAGSFLVHHPGFRQSASTARLSDIPSNPNYLVRKQAHFESRKQVSLTRSALANSQLSTQCIMHEYVLAKPKLIHCSPHGNAMCSIVYGSSNELGQSAQYSSETRITKP